MRLVPEWKRAWKWISVQSMVVAGSIQAAWMFIPDDLKSSIPHSLVQGVTIALLALGVVGRVVKQGKP